MRSSGGQHFENQASKEDSKKHTTWLEVLQKSDGSGLENRGKAEQEKILPKAQKATSIRFPREVPQP